MNDPLIAWSKLHLPFVLTELPTPHPYVWKGLPPMFERTNPSSNTTADRILHDLAPNPAEDTAYLVQHYADAAHSLAQAADLIIKTGYKDAGRECVLVTTAIVLHIRTLLLSAQPKTISP